MRVGIAIDVTTDVSHEFVTENNIYVLPSTVHMGNQSVVYDRDPANALAFYREHSDSRSSATETTAFSVKEIEDLFLNKLVLQHDYVFFITLSSTHSQTYDNAHKASFTILQSYAQVREANNVVGPFALRVVDSLSIFAGPGVLTWETVRLVRAQIPPVEIRQRLDDLAPHIHAYMVPNDLHNLRARGARRGDDNVGWLRYGFAKLFDVKPVICTNRSESAPIAYVRHFDKAVEKVFLHAAAQIRRGLLVPMIGISYSGDPEKLRAIAGFDTLSKTATEHGVELMLSIMSPTAAINVGIGTMSLAYCAKELEEFET
ncbi:MAG: DegV family protein [Pseudomonadota bacterium]